MKISAAAGIFCDLLQPFGNTFAAVSRNFFAAISRSGSKATDRFCGGHVEDEVVVDLDDSPGTTNGTNFSVLQWVRFPFLVRRGS